MSGTKIVLMCR